METEYASAKFKHSELLDGEVEITDKKGRKATVQGQDLFKLVIDAQVRRTRKQLKKYYASPRK